jgi:hypothetical protein
MGANTTRDAIASVESPRSSHTDNTRRTPVTALTRVTLRSRLSRKAVRARDARWSLLARDYSHTDVHVVHATLHRNQGPPLRILKGIHPSVQIVIACHHLPLQIQQPFSVAHNLVPQHSYLLPDCDPRSLHVIRSLCFHSIDLIIRLVFINKIRNNVHSPGIMR